MMFRWSQQSKPHASPSHSHMSYINGFKNKLQGIWKTRIGFFMD